MIHAFHFITFEREIWKRMSGARKQLGKDDGETDAEVGNVKTRTFFK